MLDLGVALLSRIEHQMLELLHWSVPMGPLYQTYADAIFDAASRQLGRQVAAPQVLLAFDEHTAHTPSAVHAAVQSCVREVPQCAASKAHSWDGTTSGASPCATTRRDLS